MWNKIMTTMSYGAASFSSCTSWEQLFFILDCYVHSKYSCKIHYVYMNIHECTIYRDRDMYVDLQIEDRYVKGLTSRAALRFSFSNCNCRSYASFASLSFSKVFWKVLLAIWPPVGGASIPSGSWQKNRTS